MNLKKIVVAIIILVLANFSRDLVRTVQFYSDFIENAPWFLKWSEQAVLWLFFIWIGFLIIKKFKIKAMLNELGLDRSIRNGLFFAFVATSPFLIALPFAQLDFSDIDIRFLIFTVTIWPLSEEIIYRGYFFTQIFKNLAKGFWPAALLSSAVFALVHLANPSIQALPIGDIFLNSTLLFVYSILGVWIFVKMGLNLWVLFGLHALLNFYWDLGFAETPLGGITANILRLLSLILAILLALYWNKVVDFLNSKSKKEILTKI